MSSDDAIVYTLPKEYRYVLIAAFVHSLYFFGRVMGVMSGPGGRGAVMELEWLKERFGQEHKEATGEEIIKGGYPDNGNGRYTMARGYKAWVEFN